MTHVVCEQLRYTWAERRLDGVGRGFGVVVRSAGWPPELLHDPAIREVLTSLDGDIREESPETAPTVVAYLTWQHGSLLVAKRPVGQDGAGRPGNYAVHALYDASGTLGSLDLAPLADGGTFVLEREVDIEPVDRAPAVTVWAAPDWRPNGSLAQMPGASSSAGHVFGDTPLTYRDPTELADLLRQLCLRLPADLVNQLEITRAGGLTAGPTARGQIDQLIADFDEAVGLGIVKREGWWVRRGLGATEWLADTRGFVTMNQPVQRVPDDLLWTRWDHATPRGRVKVAQEIIARGSRLRTEEAVAAVTARPELLNEMLEAGIKGGATGRRAAAEWVAMVGDDQLLVEVAAELRHLGEDEGLPKSVLDRLQRLSPERVRPGSLLEYVASHLDGAVTLDPQWRAHCLQLRLAGRVTCSHPEELITSSSERDLTDAYLAVRTAGIGIDTRWANLAPLDWSARARVALSSGPDAVDFLVHRESGKGSGPTAEEAVDVWPQIARTAGWSTWVRNLTGPLESRIRQLQAQRLLLLIAVGILVVISIVLGIL